MFKLISANDKNAISNRLFVKNAEFLQDLTAFFDVYSNICDEKLENLPEFCKNPDGGLNLEGICMFIKTYSSEFNFASLDLPLSYLKILYYTISSLSTDGVTVSKDVLVSEYLSYKETNKKYCDAAKKKLDELKTQKDEKIQKFEDCNNLQAKCFIWSRITDILAVVSIILALFVAVLPFAFFYAGRIALKSTIIYAVASIAIGLILRFEFKMVSRYISNIADEKSYELQTLKKNKNEILMLYNGFLTDAEKLFVQKYEFDKDFNPVIEFDRLSFKEILEKAKLLDINSVLDKDSATKLDQEWQEHIYDIIDKIASANIEEIGRLENTYEEIISCDYLMYNNYVRHSFISKAIDNAILDKKWNLMLKSDDNPFGIDYKAITKDKISVAYKNKIISMPYSSFKNSKYKKLTKVPRLKRINNEENIIDAEYKYLLHYGILDDDNHHEFRLARPLEIKTGLVKTRVMMSVIGENNYLKARQSIINYENQNAVIEQKEKTEKQLQNETNEKEYIRSMFECDELKLLDSGEVLCIVGDKTYKGFRLSKI